MSLGMGHLYNIFIDYIQDIQYIHIIFSFLSFNIPTFISIIFFHKLNLKLVFYFTKTIKVNEVSTSYSTRSAFHNNLRFYVI